MPVLNEKVPITLERQIGARDIRADIGVFNDVQLAFVAGRNCSICVKCGEASPQHERQDAVINS